MPGFLCYLWRVLLSLALVLLCLGSAGANPTVPPELQERANQELLVKVLEPLACTELQKRYGPEYRLEKTTLLKAVHPPGEKQSLLVTLNCQGCVPPRAVELTFQLFSDGRIVLQELNEQEK